MLEYYHIKSTFLGKLFNRFDTVILIGDSVLFKKKNNIVREIKINDFSDFVLLKRNIFRTTLLLKVGVATYKLRWINKYNIEIFSYNLNEKILNSIQEDLCSLIKDDTILLDSLLLEYIYFILFSEINFFTLLTLDVSIVLIGILIFSPILMFSSNLLLYVRISLIVTLYSFDILTHNFENFQYRKKNIYNSV